MTASNHDTVSLAKVSSRLMRGAKQHEAGQPAPSRRPVVLTPSQAADLVESGDTILINGSGGGIGTPERFLEALADRYRRSGQPSAITAVHPVGCGDWGERGSFFSSSSMPGIKR